MKEKKEKAKKDVEDMVFQAHEYKPHINKKSERMVQERAAIMMLSSPEKSVD